MAARRFKATIRQSALLLVLGTILGAASNAVRTDGLPWTGAWSPPPKTASLLQGLEVISLKQAWSLYEEGRAVFLDARDPMTFQEGHLPGALNVPPEEAGSFAHDLRALAEAGMELIAYCDGESCPLSPELAGALQSNGVDPVRVLVDGWTRWREAGYPTEGRDQ